MSIGDQLCCNNSRLHVVLGKPTYPVHVWYSDITFSIASIDRQEQQHICQIHIPSALLAVHYHLPRTLLPRHLHPRNLHHLYGHLAFYLGLSNRTLLRPSKDRCYVDCQEFLASHSSVRESKAILTARSDVARSQDLAYHNVHCLRPARLRSR